MKPVNVGILGLGTVGSGTVNVLTRNADEIRRRAGRDIHIVMASARDLSKPRACDTSGIQLTQDPFEIVNHPEIDIVVELIGGDKLAKELTLRAIENNKHVVTANKALIALHGNEIFSAAEKQGVVVAFEAAVAGGIAIIKAIREGMAGNRIQWLAGIINGTTNFILTEMRDKGRNFDDVLAEAQALGYAEADPTFDVEGIDAAHKLTILSSIAFGVPLDFASATTEGITAITAQDVKYAQKLGYRIKHLGITRRAATGIELRVHPTLIPERRLIANVDGVMNAVLVIGDAVGPTLHYGAGAGAEPTASAVVADIVDVTRVLTSDPDNRVPHLAFRPSAISNAMPVLDMADVRTAYYLRLRVADKPGVLADITRILGDHEISIKAIEQVETSAEENAATVVMLTDSTYEKRMNEALSEINALTAVINQVVRIRVEHLDA